MAKLIGAWTSGGHAEATKIRQHFYEERVHAQELEHVQTSAAKASLPNFHPKKKKEKNTSRMIRSQERKMKKRV